MGAYIKQILISRYGGLVVLIGNSEEMGKPKLPDERYVRPVFSEWVPQKSTDWQRDRFLTSLLPVPTNWLSSVTQPYPPKSNKSSKMRDISFNYPQEMNQT